METKMTEIINLNKVRKAKRKQSEKAKAAENRIRHGVSSKIRAAEARATGLRISRLEQHRLNPTEEQEKNVD
jgi:hypothetical protein